MTIFKKYENNANGVGTHLFEDEDTFARPCDRPASLARQFQQNRPLHHNSLLHRQPCNQISVVNSAITCRTTNNKLSTYTVNWPFEIFPVAADTTNSWNAPPDNVVSASSVHSLRQYCINWRIFRLSDSSAVSTSVHLAVISDICHCRRSLSDVLTCHQTMETETNN